VPSWREALPGCFSPLDRLFAMHSMDETRAFEVLALARAEGATWRDVSDFVREFLEGDGCSIQHIELAVQQVEARFRPWLGD
jgi:hypothetical protein